MSWTQERARYAAISRHRPGDTAALAETARDLAAERLAAHVERVVAQAPTLSVAQRDRIAALLRSGASGGDAA